MRFSCIRDLSSLTSRFEDEGERIGALYLMYERIRRHGGGGLLDGQTSRKV